MALCRFIPAVPPSRATSRAILSWILGASMLLGAAGTAWAEVRIGTLLTRLNSLEDTLFGAVDRQKVVKAEDVILAGENRQINRHPIDRDVGVERTMPGPTWIRN